MSSPAPARMPPRLSRAVAAVLAGLPLAAAATPDFTVPAVVCVPGDTQTMDNENKPLTAGVVRLPGRNTPPRLYYCPVFNPDFTSMQPSWRHLKLTYADNTSAAGNVVVRLYAKSRGKLATDPPVGKTFPVGQVASVPASGVAVVAAPLAAALDFHRFVYWFAVEMRPPTGGLSPQVDVHDVQLTD